MTYVVAPIDVGGRTGCRVLLDAAALAWLAATPGDLSWEIALSEDGFATVVQTCAAYRPTVAKGFTVFAPVHLFRDTDTGAVVERPSVWPPGMLLRSTLTVEA